MLKNALSIFILRPLLVSTLFILSACSGLKSSEFSRQSPGPDGEYLGWHCEGEVALRDNWNCSEKLLKDGLVVVEPAAQVEVAAETEALEVDSFEITTAVEEGVNPKASVNKVHSNKAPSKKVPSKKVPSKKAPDTRFPKFDISANGYTVQLGAYLSQALAERAADNMILPGGELRIRDIVTAERRFFVLVYGRYQTRQQAEVASEPLVVLNSGLNYWIRSIASMRKGD